MRRFPLVANRLRWGALAIALTSVVAMLATSSAQALVVNDQGTTAGVALLPVSGERATLPSGTIVTSSGSCADPALTSDLAYAPNMNQLCYHGGGVIHSNETFALTWDPLRRYWSGTRGYVEQFLRDVADASGSLNDPFALTTQYTDGSGRGGNTSKYGGGCIDYGNPNNTSNTNTTCLFGNGVANSPGYNYPSNGCTPTGGSYIYATTNPNGIASNDTCLTDGQIQGEIATIVNQSGILGRTQAGYTPMVVMLVPPQVEVCLDTSGTLCSANSSAAAQFCSYHSQVLVNGTEVPYVVQPWTPKTSCDEPDVPAIPPNPPVNQLASLVGQRLVSPISQSEVAAISDPGLNGWSALDGSEMNDNNGCVPVGHSLDQVTVGSNSYLLQRDWNNGAAISFDPNTYFGCAPNVLLSPSFVVPSAVNPGDSVVFDGSATASTLIVPNAGYVWDFGDHTGATGPSVVHSYASGGNYTVKLTVTDRGGNAQTLSQPISVLGFNGLPVPPSNPPTSNPSNTGSTPSGLQVRMQLMPQGLRGVLRSGIAVQVSSNGPANGLAYVSITRATARRVHIKAGHWPAVIIGRGTVSEVKDGTITLRLRLSRSVASKLKTLKHVTLSVRLALVGSAGDRLAIDAAGRY